MYPSDDGPIRLRLLIAQSRAVRQRLQERLAEFREARDTRPDVGSTPAAEPETSPEYKISGGGGREMSRRG